MRTQLSLMVALLTLVIGFHELRADDAQTVKTEVDKAKAAEIIVKGSLSESPGAIGIFGEIDETLRDMIERIDRATKDKEVAAIILKIRNPAIGRGKLEELRSAILRARAAKKKVVAQLSIATMADYLLASACDEIEMPESGSLIIPGIRAEASFYGGLFEKLDIEADMIQIGAYKGAAEPFTRKGMSDDFRKQYELLVDDLYAQIIETIATDRKLDKDKVKQLIDIGLFTADSAKEAGLVDTVAYDDATVGRLKEQLEVDEVEVLAKYGRKKVDTDFSGMMGFVKLFELMMGAEPSKRSSKNKKIALVYAVGPIMTGSSSASMFGGEVVGSDTIVKALRKANDEETVAAIVLRVDSPGGSALASDLIWREIKRIDKPVIASMGDVAASGGYYISMGCDKIYAEPGTITGSIGVVGGKIVTSGLFEKVGVNTEVISRGKNTGILSTESKFTDSERKAYKETMEDIYRQFTTKAAEGRGMNVKQLEKLAGGRVWTGSQAKKNGLVDEIGTLRDAILAAKKEAGMGEDDKAELLILPEPTSIFDELLGIQAAAPAIEKSVESVAPGFTKHLRQLDILQRLFAAEPGVLVMPYQLEIK